MLLWPLLLPLSLLAIAAASWKNVLSNHCP